MSKIEVSVDPGSYARHRRYFIYSSLKLENGHSDSPILWMRQLRPTQAVLWYTVCLGQSDSKPVPFPNTLPWLASLFYQLP